MRFSADEHLRDMMAIVAADSHDALQQHLVLRPPALRGPDPMIPTGAFRKVHRAGVAGAVDTFVVMATDARWSSNAHQVIAELVATGLIDDADLDTVAEVFVRADTALNWECPEHWFGDWVTIDISLPGDRDDTDAEASDDDGDVDPGPTYARREIPRGTRRWAAERVIRRGLVSWEWLLKRVDAMPAKNAAPLLHGLLDAADQLPEQAARRVDRRGADSGDVVVRLAALRRIASYDRDEALRRGERDGNRRVRQWANSGGPPEHPVSPEDGGTLF